MSLNFLRKTVMSEPLFDDWDDFMDAVDSLEDKEVIERFTDENGELSSVKLYSKINCLLDCNMKYAENICGCRPWDYPTSEHGSKTSTRNQLRICDFYGSSCFNRALQQNLKSKCDSKCVPNCDEIDYSVVIEVEPIDPKKRICSYFDESKSITIMEL